MAVSVPTNNICELSFYGFPAVAERSFKKRVSSWVLTLISPEDSTSIREEQNRPDSIFSRLMEEFVPSNRNIVHVRLAVHGISASSISLYTNCDSFSGVNLLQQSWDIPGTQELCRKPRVSAWNDPVHTKLIGDSHIGNYSTERSRKEFERVACTFKEES